MILQSKREYIDANRWCHQIIVFRPSLLELRPVRPLIQGEIWGAKG